MCTTPQYTIKLNQQGPPGPKGEPGTPGFSPEIGVAVQDDTTYILNITNQNGTIQTPNLQGRGVPSNGLPGQWLISDGNNLAHWENAPEATTTNKGMIRLPQENDIYNIDSDTDWEPSDSTAITPKDMIDYVYTEVDDEATARDNADQAIWQEIETLELSSDVADIVGTYQELLDYDTSTLTNDDIIKVLSDSTHSNAIAYYRWVVVGGVGSWSYIGGEGPYYTQSQVDSLITASEVPATNSGIYKDNTGKLFLDLSNTDGYLSLTIADTSVTSPVGSYINLNAPSFVNLINTTIGNATIDGGLIA